MNVSKPKPPKGLLEETVVELKTDFPTAVRRLQQLSGLCRKKSVAGFPLYFDSHKMGRFSVTEIGTRNHPSTAAVGVKGGLYAEEGRTKAAVFTYRISGSTAAVAVFVVTEVLLFLLMVLGWYLTLREGFVPVYAVLAFVSLGIQVAFWCIIYPVTTSPGAMRTRMPIGSKKKPFAAWPPSMNGINDPIHIQEV